MQHLSPFSNPRARGLVLRRFFLPLLALTIMAGCSSPTRAQVRGIAPLNVNDTNESTPVDVRFYQLAATERFEKAPFEALWLDAAKELDDELLTKPLVVSILPCSATSEPQAVELGTLKDTTRFIGIMALYRRGDGRPRILIVPRERIDGALIELTGYTIRLATTK